MKRVSKVILTAALVGSLVAPQAVWCSESDTIALRVTVVDTPPHDCSVVIDGGAPYATTGDVTLTVSAHDTESGVAESSFSNDAVTWSAPAPYAPSRAWSLTAGDGDRTVWAKFKDTMGHWSSPCSDTIKLDTIAPDIALTAPLDGAEVFGVVTVTATASDPTTGINRVEFYLDGALQSTDTASPYSFVWNTTALANGPPHTIRAVAYDGAGRSEWREAVVTIHNMYSIARVVGHQIWVQKRNLDGTLEADAPYTIRGVAWSPAAVGIDGGVATRRAQFAAWVATDAPLMAAMNVNTVRTYIDFGSDAVALATLDTLYANGIMAVMGIDGDGRGNLANALQVVAACRNHPAVLMWMIGNEWNINCYGTVDPAVRQPTTAELNASAYSTQSLVNAIKQADPTHLVVTGYGDLAFPSLATTQNFVQNVCTAVDVWGINVYRGSTFGTTFTDWDGISTKPMCISEFGTDSYYAAVFGGWPITGAEDEAMQADFDMSLWNDLCRNLSARDAAKVAVGGAVFAWCDEWWKVPSSAGGSVSVHDNGGYYTTWNRYAFPDGCGNEEYFGIVTITRETKQAYTDLTVGFDPNYVPPPPTRVYKAVSKGSNPDGHTWASHSRFYNNSDSPFFDHVGEVPYRGMNLAVIDNVAGTVDDARNFDTYASAANATALANYLNGVADGKIIMLSIADEGTSNLSPAYSAIQALGSQHVTQIGFRNSWTMIVKKGDPAYYVEDYGSGEKTVTCGIPLDE